MRGRWLSFLAMLVVVAVPSAARPEEKAQAPTVVVRIKSINDLIQDAKFLAKLGGQEDKAKEVDTFIEGLKTGEKGLQGIDMNRPLGMYGTLGGDEMASGVVLVPVADEKTLVDFVGQFGIKAEKGNEGIYSVTSENFPIPVAVYVRFAHKYAYISAMNDKALAKDKLLDPGKVLAGSRPATFSAKLRLDQVPDMIKDLALGQMDNQLAEEQNKDMPGESAAAKKFRQEILKVVAKDVAAVIKDGGDVEVYVDLDRKANTFSGEISLTGKKGTKLHAGIADLNKDKSIFGGLGGDNPAFNLLMHVALPEDVRKSLSKVIDENLKKEIDKEKDETKRAAAKKVLHAVEPTLKSGEVDAALALRGPGQSKHYGVVAGIRVKDGKAIEKAVQEILESVPAEHKALLKLNAETIDGTSVHRIDIQKEMDEKGRAILGDNPVFIAFKDDAVMVAAGEDGLEALKAAFHTEARSGQHLSVELALAQLGSIFAEGDPKVAEEVAKISDAAFKGGKDLDKIKITLEGGDALKARFSMSTAAVQFLAQLGQNETIQKAKVRTFEGPIGVKVKPPKAPKPPKDDD